VHYRDEGDQTDSKWINVGLRSKVQDTKGSTNILDFRWTTKGVVYCKIVSTYTLPFDAVEDSIIVRIFGNFYEIGSIPYRRK